MINSRERPWPVAWHGRSLCRTASWRPKRPGPFFKQGQCYSADTAGRHKITSAPPLEKPYPYIGAWADTAAEGQNLIHPAVLGSVTLREQPRCQGEHGMAWWMSVKDSWPPKRPGPASDRD